ncbi:SAP domain-containing ribonucleoprotein [Prorops nasuta]|uniref:SAP domain-containing ribonucleoprotein n=1 Tax=Prorops nasuta TaxID=863751 RepID=UPI0034CF8BBD
MADSSYEKGLTELSKMKVADLRIELKNRGLPTTGNKNELVERLQLAIHGDPAFSLDDTNEELLDEDAAVLGDEEIEELSNKPDSQEVNESIKLSADTNGTNVKKIILNRNPVIEEVKLNEAVNKEDNESSSRGAISERTIIRLSELGVEERLKMRAKKFGMPLSEPAKKDIRSARFNTNDQNSKSASSVKTPVPTTYEILKKRAERFGTSVSNVMEKAELQERIEKRKARFGEVKPTEKVFSKKLKLVK